MDFTRPELPLRTPLRAELAELTSQRHPLADEDVHFTRALAQAVIEDLSQPGDRVLDPFAGFGTTLAVATQLGRRGVGIEVLPERCALAASVAPHAAMICGDARQLPELISTPFELVLTSPPYRAWHEQAADPLTGYRTPGGDYASYLAGLEVVLGHALHLLTPGGYAVINVANIAAAEGFTPLAWDVGGILGRLATVVQDVPVIWDDLPHDLCSDHLIVAQRR